MRQLTLSIEGNRSSINFDSGIWTPNIVIFSHPSANIQSGFIWHYHIICRCTRIEGDDHIWLIRKVQILKGCHIPRIKEFTARCVSEEGMGVELPLLRQGIIKHIRESCRRSDFPRAQISIHKLYVFKHIIKGDNLTRVPIADILGKTSCILEGTAH